MPDQSHCRRIGPRSLIQQYCRPNADRLFFRLHTTTNDRYETDFRFRLILAFGSSQTCRICETCLLHSLILLAVSNESQYQLYCCPIHCVELNLPIFVNRIDECHSLLAKAYHKILSLYLARNCTFCLLV